MDDKELLKQKLDSGFQLSMGDVLSNSFDLFGKAAGKYILLMLFGLLASIVLGLLFVISWQLAVAAIVIVVLVGVPAMQVGLARFTKKIMEGRKPEFADFFSGFKHNLSQLILQSVLVFIITMTISVSLDFNYYYDYYQTILMSVGDIESAAQNMIDFSARHEDFSWLRTFSGIFSFYIGLGLSLTPYIVSFYKVSAFTAMDISFRAVNKVVFKVGILHIVLGILGVFGFIIFLVGALASFPIMFIGTYLIFKYTIGEKDSKTNDEWAVNEHLI